MSKCTRCGKERSWLEFDIGSGECGECQRIPAQRATLGCGTLFAIGVIVALVTGGFVDDDEVRDLERSVDDLEEQVENQSQEIRLLRTEIEALTAALAPAP